MILLVVSRVLVDFYKRQRLEISSSKLPRFDAHPNLSVNPAQATEARVARQQIHHAAETPSFLELHLLL